MPNVPKWVADQLENLLPSKFLTVEVTAVIQYSPKIKGISFRGNLSGMDFFPGSAINFRVSETEIRHYTPFNFDKENGTFNIFFHIHGNGPGSNFADKLQPGDRSKVSVPGGRKIFDRDQQNHFFFGDETSLSFYAVALKEIVKNGQFATAIFELEEENRSIPEKLGLDIHVVRKSSENPGGEAVRLLNDWFARYPDPLTQSIFYLTGNATAAQQFRSVLKKRGISSKNIKLQGYWSEGRVGL